MWPSAARHLRIIGPHKIPKMQMHMIYVCTLGAKILHLLPTTVATFSSMNTNVPIRSGIYLCGASVMERFEKGRGQLFSTGKHSFGKMSYLLINWDLCLKMTVESVVDPGENLRGAIHSNFGSCGCVGRG